MNLLNWYMFYMLLMVMSLTSNNWLSMWTLLELSSWVMLILMFSDSDNSDTIFKMYFMFSMISIGIVMLWLNMVIKQEWVMFLFALKMGIPPCHWWLGWILKNFKWKMFWWFTTMHKFIPMVFSLLLMNSYLLFFWALLSTLWSTLSAWGTNSLFMLLFYSSCMHASWMWSSVYDLYTFCYYFVIYVSMMSSLLYMMYMYM
uniref:NADH dehydrogenase subunit 2 n=1 Tax=Capillaria sp. cat-2018 TaxID=2488633 RepID=A0A6M2UJ39_9BILA|nr:NADH dehydrogenase subunit 2 [Capillaria sp. cat-2018]